MDITEYLLIFTLILLVACLLNKPRNYPPGPYSLPLLGNIPALAVLTARYSQHAALWTLSKRYGPILGLFIGPQPVVVVSGYRDIKHVLERQDFSFRPHVIPAHSHFYKKRLGIIFSDGDEWRQQRSFAIQNLRNFGFSNENCQTVIHKEITALINAIEALTISKQSENGIDVISLFSLATVNAIWSIIAGERSDFHDHNFSEMTKTIFEYFREGNQTSIVTNYRILQKIPIINTAYRHQLKLARKVQTFIERTIEEHRATYNENNVRNFLDAYLREIRMSRENSSFSRSQLCITCFDLLSAGSETTSGTISYCLRYMLQYPQVQETLRAEVQRVVGGKRLPKVDDIQSMHYAQAVFAETLRHSGLVAVPPPHATSEEVRLKGYTIPKGTIILTNLWSVHMDQHIWGDPQNFRPERFLSPAGTFVSNEHLIPFGLGPRKCLGTALAKNTALLVLASLLQRFVFRVADAEAANFDDQLPGFTTAPVPFLVKVSQLPMELASPADSGISGLHSP